jgi:diguanylate cyclase (GGDEF)-like protein/PAS domain S-box-containing protein
MRIDLSILDHMPIGVFIIDRDFNILFWNKRLSNWTGLDGGEMAGKNLLQQYPHLDAPQYRYRLEAVFNSGPPVIFSNYLHEYIIPASLPDGSFRRQHCTASPIGLQGHEGPVALFTLQDVTEVHRRIIQVSELKDKTQQELDLRIEAEARLLENEKRLEELAATDELTGAANRRKLFEVLDDEVKRCFRYKTEVSFLMVDADYFKLINDTYGHDAGDAVLRQMVIIIQGHLREVDLLGRFGGEEFGVVLPQTSASGALQVAERMRAGIESALFRFNGGEHSLTVSIGLASTRGGDDPQAALDELVRQADQALYKAKDQGRNRVVGAGQDPE